MTPMLSPILRDVTNTIEMTTNLLAQTLAPRLFKMFGVPPEEMGFPIYDTKEEVADHLEKQFSPVEYWTDRGREMAASILRILAAGGATIPAENFQAMIDAAIKECQDTPNEKGEAS